MSCFLFLLIGLDYVSLYSLHISYPTMHLILVICIPIMLLHKIENKGFSLTLLCIAVDVSKSCIECIGELALALGYASEFLGHTRALKALEELHCFLRGVLSDLHKWKPAC